MLKSKLKVPLIRHYIIFALTLLNRTSNLPLNPLLVNFNMYINICYCSFNYSRTIRIVLRLAENLFARYRLADTFDFPKFDYPNLDWPKNSILRKPLTKPRLNNTFIGWHLDWRRHWLTDTSWHLKDSNIETIHILKGKFIVYLYLYLIVVPVCYYFGYCWPP